MRRRSALNRESYNAIARSWDAARHALSTRESAYLDRLLDGVAPAARILDLGCGTGRPIAEALLRRGFCVTGVDQAETLLALAMQRLPSGRWLHASMESFEPDEVYDGAVIWDALFHVPRAVHASILRKVIGSLRTGAKLMVTVGGLDAPAFTDTMFGQPFFYDALGPERTVSELQNLGAVIEHAEFLDPPTRGRDRGRYALLAKVCRDDV